MFIAVFFLLKLHLCQKEEKKTKNIDITVPGEVIGLLELGKQSQAHQIWGLDQKTTKMGQ